MTQQQSLPLLTAMDAVKKATRKKPTPDMMAAHAVEKYIGYRKIKSHAKELEKGNFKYLIAFPSQVLPKDKEESKKTVWYKMGNFSALCYGSTEAVQNQ